MAKVKAGRVTMPKQVSPMVAPAVAVGEIPQGLVLNRASHDSILASLPSEDSFYANWGQGWEEPERRCRIVIMKAEISDPSICTMILPAIIVQWILILEALHVYTLQQVSHQEGWAPKEHISSSWNLERLFLVLHLFIANFVMGFLLVFVGLLRRTIPRCGVILCNITLLMLSMSSAYWIIKESFHKHMDGSAVTWFPGLTPSEDVRLSKYTFGPSGVFGNFFFSPDGLMTLKAIEFALLILVTGTWTMDWSLGLEAPEDDDDTDLDAYPDPESPDWAEAESDLDVEAGIPEELPTPTNNAQPPTPPTIHPSPSKLRTKRQRFPFSVIRSRPDACSLFLPDSPTLPGDRRFKMVWNRMGGDALPERA